MEFLPQNEGRRDVTPGKSAGADFPGPTERTSVPPVCNAATSLVAILSLIVLLLCAGLIHSHHSVSPDRICR